MRSNSLYFIGFLLCSMGLSAQTEYTVNLYDSQRERVIPIAIYEPKHVNKNTPVVIFNHGYGQNDPNSYKMYSCLTVPLARKGYYVISIQHELPNDSTLAMTGNFMKARMPNWERGVDNMMFTINEFKKLKPDMKWSRLSIIGHSNGGDMAMLFASKFPKVAHKVISLDHRRMIMPQCNIPRIYSLRGSDYEADKNVIPTTGEQQKYHITVIKLDGIKHGDMDNKGTKEQHNTMLHHLSHFLK